MSDVELEIEARDALRVRLVPGARELGVDAFVTDRSGGVSPAPFDTLNLSDFVGDTSANVAENRRRVAEAAGVDDARLTFVHQVHGTTSIDADRVTPLSQADIVTTDASERALGVLVADCVPMLLIDDASPHLALVHGGWRGLSRGVVAAALSGFEDPRRVHAFIGPSISVQTYEVGPEVASHFSQIPDAVQPGEGDRYWLDLRGVASYQLESLGVPRAAITRSREVTDGGAVFFSHRAHQPSGRFALVAKRREP